MTAALVILGGYLLGSMPFGYWLVRLLKGEDIRKVGSGNIGATNVWRTYGKAYGIPIVLLDVAKGFVPALVGTLLVDELVGALAGGAAMLGHWRPLFLRFQKGGKTVAAAGGTFFGIAPELGAIGLAIWIVVFLVSRYSSLASMLAALALPFAGLALGEPWPVIVFAAIACVAVLVLHRPNIARLRAGTESRFQLRRRNATA
ncbi:MAG: glycerol-3-phosphate 1-O-acyltransferase PlsY [Thermoleophilia bacterium]|nr:glycerol-3-phosphate 1-O-acyltransferase PlsY [Thermoleophilia bacterium]